MSADDDDGGDDGGGGDGNAGDGNAGDGNAGDGNAGDGNADPGAGYGQGGREADDGNTTPDGNADPGAGYGQGGKEDASTDPSGGGGTFGGDARDTTNYGDGGPAGSGGATFGGDARDSSNYGDGGGVGTDTSGGTFGGDARDTVGYGGGSDAVGGAISGGGDGQVGGTFGGDARDVAGYGGASATDTSPFREGLSGAFGGDARSPSAYGAGGGLGAAGAPGVGGVSDVGGELSPSDLLAGESPISVALAGAGQPTIGPEDFFSPELAPPGIFNPAGPQDQNNPLWAPGQGAGTIDPTQPATPADTWSGFGAFPGVGGPGQWGASSTTTQGFPDQSAIGTLPGDPFVSGPGSPLGGAYLGPGSTVNPFSNPDSPSYWTNPNQREAAAPGVQVASSDPNAAFQMAGNAFAPGEEIMPTQQELDQNQTPYQFPSGWLGQGGAPLGAGPPAGLGTDPSLQSQPGGLWGGNMPGSGVGVATTPEGLIGGVPQNAGRNVTMTDVGSPNFAFVGGDTVQSEILASQAAGLNSGPAGGYLQDPSAADVTYNPSLANPGSTAPSTLRDIAAENQNDPTNLIDPSQFPFDPRVGGPGTLGNVVAPAGVGGATMDESAPAPVMSVGGDPAFVGSIPTSTRAGVAGLGQLGGGVGSAVQAGLVGGTYGQPDGVAQQQPAQNAPQGTVPLPASDPRGRLPSGGFAADPGQFNAIDATAPPAGPPNVGTPGPPDVGTPPPAPPDRGVAPTTQPGGQPSLPGTQGGVDVTQALESGDGIAPDVSGGGGGRGADGAAVNPASLLTPIPTGGAPTGGTGGTPTGGTGGTPTDGVGGPAPDGVMFPGGAPWGNPAGNFNPEEGLFGIGPNDMFANFGNDGTIADPNTIAPLVNAGQ